MSVYVIGGGGHAKVVISTLRANGTQILGVLDDDPAKMNQEVLGCKVIGTIAEYSKRGNRAIIAIGINQTRQKIASKYEFEWITAIHPSVIVDSSVKIESGAVVFAGVVIQPDSRIESHATLNTSCSVDHDCVVGAFGHIAPGARLAGDVRTGEGAFVGCGASVIQGIRIGAWSVVGAGAVVIKDVEAETTVAGCPARVLTKTG